MCAITPMPESTSTNHDGKHRHFQCTAGGVGHRKVKCEELNSQKLHGLDWDFSSFLAGNSMDSKRILSRLLTNQADGVWDPLALAAKSNSVDTYTWNKAMNSPHAKGFREAATIEHTTLESMGVWEKVKRQPWMNVLPSTWMFRVKPFADGLTRKLKARFCA